MIPLSITANLDIDPWIDLKNKLSTGGQIERIGVLATAVAQMEDL